MCRLLAPSTVPPIATSRLPRPSASAVADGVDRREDHGRTRQEPARGRGGRGQRAVVAGAVDDLGQQPCDVLQTEQLEHARIVGARAPVAERRGSRGGIRGPLAGAEEVDAVLRRERGDCTVEGLGTVPDQPGELRAAQRRVRSGGR